MKKTLTLFAVCFAIVSNAATINWGATSLYYGTDKTTADDTVGYLVYLGEFSDPTKVSYGSIDFAALAEDKDEYSAVADFKAPGSNTAGKGKINNSVDSTALLNGNSGNIVDGSSYFGTVYLYTSGNNTYYLTGATHKFDTTNYDNVASEEFSWRTDSVASNSDPSAQGWTAVPEPSTAMLALAGLALLIKRRRA